MKTVIELAQAAGYPVLTFEGVPYVSPELERLVELAREKKQAYIEPTNDKAAIVDRDYHWIDAEEFMPPRGSKMLMIDKKLGVAVLGTWRDSDGWTHWCPLPTFERKE